MDAVKLGACAGGLVIAAFAGAKCAMPQMQTAQSANGLYQAVLDPSGALKVYGRAQREDVFRLRTSGKLDIRGHHFGVLVSDAGDRVVVYDRYMGFGVYRADGSTVRYHDANGFLTDLERRRRPGKWACHTEGVWTLHPPTLENKAFQTKLYTGLTVTVDLEDGSAEVRPPSLLAQHRLMLVTLTPYGFPVAGCVLALRRRSKRHS